MAGLYPGLVRSVIYPLVQRMRGRRGILGQLQWLEQTQWLSPEELHNLQWEKLKKLLTYSFANVPYYKDMFEAKGLTPEDIQTPEDFRKLPLLSKEDIMANFSKLTSRQYSRSDLIPNSTGGSTGVNLSFFNDKKRASTELAVGLRGDQWAGLEVRDKSAHLWGSPFDLSRQRCLINIIGNQILRRLFLSSYNLSEETMYVYARKLAHYQPKVIIGYSSPLYLFAKFLQEKGIKGIRPQSIISSAETLYDFQRQLIESVFQCPVFNRYGSREFGAIAVECPEHNGLHLNIEHVYVECVKDNEPASPGEVGELVITNLDNYGMPFIRYRIGDVAVPSDRKCNCGRGLPLLERIEGRTFDVVAGTNGRCLGGTFWTLLLRTFIKGISQFQVVQKAKDQIDITIVTNEAFKIGYIDLLKSKVREYCGSDMQVNFYTVPSIPVGKSGKFRFVVSKIHSTK
ncbi:hypothetical protein ES708_15688 [subsurface metagenome]